jgi:ABC-type polysaccharide/polyol phosphate export permease
LTFAWPVAGQCRASEVFFFMRFFWCVIAPLLANVLIFFLLLWKAKSHLVVKLEYLSAALTAATLVLTGVAIVVAILAVFGYRENCLCP